MIKIAEPGIGEEEINAVVGVLKSGTIVQGPKVREFEEKFARLCNVKHAVAVNSGTAALHASLYACGVGEGDEVITVPFTFVATANSILMQRAKPVFVDIEEETFNIDPSKIEEKINGSTKAILPVDLYGQAYDYDAVDRIAKKHGLKIVEDACQAVGADYHGRKCGSLGDIASFSFYATKNLITGEGGMVTTDNPEMAELAKRLRHQGQSESARYHYFDLGYNYRMTDIMAAIGIPQIKKIENLNSVRIKNAKLLSQGLKNIKGIEVPKTKSGFKHVFHQYTIKVTEDFKLNRDEVVKFLGSKGIGSGIYYPTPLHLFSHIKKYGYKEGDFPVSEKLSMQVLSLPVHPGVSESQIQEIISAFGEME
ncbi:MAG TPA: DegT/DnrJ/EryC1/StrS family aminotransferase [Candidatus Nanoarchaeia archaeon]|nr:DegT/DnrJ/EryC1/StrS family aminotransferase [Candidatus Nanoarchaeia archaeon]